MAKKGQTFKKISVIFKNDIKLLQELLERFMMESVSSFDGTNESFYHGMMLGLCAVVSNRYRINSNRESGLRRSDIELYPTNKSNLGFIFELKYAKSESELDSMAQKAIDQIEEKKYDTAMKVGGISNIVKIDIAFCGKST